MTEPVIELKSVCKHFGGIRAVNDLSFSINPNEIVGLIGPNGSGKSTSVNLLSGFLSTTSGEIYSNGVPITTMNEQERVNIGLARTFQTAAGFPGFTVQEQMLLACHTRLALSPMGAIFRSRSSQLALKQQSLKVAELIEFVGLSGHADTLVESLSSAQQRLLMIGTALASDPKIILLDEPAAGMVASEREKLAQLIIDIKARGVSVMVIEHHMALILGVCDRIVVLNFGQKIAEGTPTEIRNNQNVIDAYLGESH